MGLFKGMKDLKALGDHHGGMPSMKSAFKDIAAVADDRGEREILKNGTPAKAVAKGFTQPVPGDRFAMQIPLEIHPPGGEPYEVNYVFTAARMKAAITVGMEIPVKIDPEDPQRIAVQWDAQQASIAAKANAAAEDPAAKLKKLGDMRDSGLITEEEFAAKKAELLAEM